MRISTNKFSSDLICLQVLDKSYTIEINIHFLVFKQTFIKYKQIVSDCRLKLGKYSKKNNHLPVSNKRIFEYEEIKIVFRYVYN